MRQRQRRGSRRTRRTATRQQIEHKIMCCWNFLWTNAKHPPTIHTERTEAEEERWSVGGSDEMDDNKVDVVSEGTIAQRDDGVIVYVMR